MDYNYSNYEFERECIAQAEEWQERQEYGSYPQPELTIEEMQ